ncbi:zinc finger protein 85 [Nephila pilipes]|uniref:Zinc finger protein 85 n=1 Tax=Nephila pilipes TaxID=299642 RepID=A0A8X6NG26_NEPPI|nr:zinc finger protein 85 [Nephila pilipes]
MSEVGTMNSENRDEPTNHFPMQRPKFYECTECKNKFTKLALEVHKMTCTEQKGCSCKVCMETEVQIISRKHAGKEGIDVGEPLRDLGNYLHNNSSNHENTIVMKCKNTRKRTYSDTYKEHSLEDSHNGHPCNRKLYCCDCKMHIFWKSVVNHAFTHSITKENNSLTCTALNNHSICNAIFSSSELFLMHFYSHTVDHLICLECVCNHCVELSRRHSELSSPQCYICEETYGEFSSLVTHMEQHIKETVD